MKHIFSFLMVVLFPFLFPSCVSDSRFEEKQDVSVVTTAQLQMVMKHCSVQPGMTYVSPLASRIFSSVRFDKTINEQNVLGVHVYGITKTAPFYKWAFLGDAPCRLSCRFLWFDAEGTILTDSEETRFCDVALGDPVRFAVRAPDKRAVNVSLLFFLKDEEKQNSCDPDVVEQKPAEDKILSAEEPEKSMDEHSFGGSEPVSKMEDKKKESAEPAWDVMRPGVYVKKKTGLPVLSAE